MCIRDRCKTEYSTRRAYHVYIFRYAPGFEGVSRDKFIEALLAEGVCATGGYPIALNKQPVYQKITPPAGMPPYAEELLPNTETLCRDTIWIAQPCLLGGKEVGEKIAEAITKVANNIDELRA